MTPTASASEVDTNPMCPADLNRDGIVNILDLAIVGKAWDSYPGHPKWNPDADLNDDDVVNILDMVLVVKDFGMTWIRYDFDDPLDWNVISGTWSIMNGSLEGSGNREGLIQTRDMTWEDCKVTAKVKIAPDSGQPEAALCIRFVDSGNFYWAGLGCWGHRVSISRIVDHVPEELIFSGDRADVVKDVWYVLSIEVFGDTIALYVNDTLELVISDSTFTSGVVGIRTWNSHILVDYVTVSGFALTPTDARARITYFQCSFAYEGPEPYSKGDWWPRWEPCGYQNEKGVWHWVVIRRTKEPYSGNMRLIPDPADPSRLCLETIFDYPGARPLPENQHAYVNNIQDREKANWGEPYATSKEAYYSFKIWFPQDFQVKGWRNFWFYRGEYYAFHPGPGFVSWNPSMKLCFEAGNSDRMLLKVDDAYYKDGKNRYYTVMNGVPREQWLNFEIYVKQGSAFQAEDGTVIIWVNGSKVVEQHDVSTATPSGLPYIIWGVGNYGGHYEAQGQSIYFKDVMVTSEYTGS